MLTGHLSDGLSDSLPEEQTDEVGHNQTERTTNYQAQSSLAGVRGAELGADVAG